MKTTLMTLNQTRWLFGSAALFNLGAAVILFAPLGLAAALGVQPLPAGGPYESVMLAAIAIFGVGYLWVAIDPDANRGIAALGMLGKIAVVAVVYGYGIVGEANLVFMALVSGDLVYALLFALFLITHN